MPKISVIVPIYNVKAYINKCIDSILGQTFKDFELILVDDGSPDDCGRICDEYAKKDNRIIVIHKENGGLSDARNAGIDWVFENSKSEWITFIDSDDYVNSELLEKLLDAAKKNFCNISCCYFLSVKDHDFINTNKSNAKSSVVTPNELFCNGFIDRNKAIQTCAWAKLYKRSLFQNIRYPVGRFFEDTYITHELLFGQREIAIYEDKLYYYFANPESISRSKLSVKKINDRFYGKKVRLGYFYNNHIDEPFKLSYDECCRDIQKCMLLYSKNDELVIAAKKQKNELFSFMETLPSDRVKFNYKAEYKKRLKKTKKTVFSYIKSDYFVNVKGIGKVRALLIALKDLMKLITNHA